ncbi:MAG TPA: mechanosensitive ion channel family protein, partial [Bacillales bacterium]|nr:mechanosensitive ion channel family protein [Bacillales bacterium]
EEDINRAEQAIESVVSEMASKHPEIVRPPEVLGVQTLGSSDVTLRVIAETLPMEHWHISREIRKAVKLRFDEIGIEIPYPRLVTYHRDDLDQVEEKMRKDEG